MSEYRVTAAGLIAWVENTTEGKEAWDDHHGGSIADYLADYADYENILDLVAGDIGYPGDKETQAPGHEIDTYAILLTVSESGVFSIDAVSAYELGELDDDVRAVRGDEVATVEATSRKEALETVLNENPSDGALATLARRALAA